MFDSAIIQVAIGLIFVFSLLAILVTQINTIITSIFNMRAKELKSGLQDLITDKQLQARLLAHPLIRMVRVSVPSGVKMTVEAAEAIASSQETRVNYIPPKEFVEALIAELISDAEKGLYGELQQAIHALPSSTEKSQLRELLTNLDKRYSEETLREIHMVANQISDTGHREQLLLGIQAIETRIQKAGLKSDQLVPLLEGINQISDPNLRSALKTILKRVDDLAEAQAQLVDWFDDGMNRVSETYKSRLRFYSVLAAFVLAVVLNVDTFFLGRTLWEDPILRGAVVDAALEFDQSQVEDTSPTNPKTLRRQAEETQETIQNLLELQLPIGWQFTPVDQQMIDTSLRLGLPDPTDNPRNFWNFIPGNSDNWGSLWIKKLIGLVVTTIAAAQGAPFWFDLLNNITKRFQR